MVLVRLSPTMPSPVTEPDAATHALALLCAAATAKYAAFALGAFPALAPDSYGVLGVEALTRELGREAVLHRGRAGGPLPPPVSLPEHECSPRWDLSIRSRLGDAVRFVVVTLSLGACGRRADGAYWRPRAQAVPYSELLSA
jgi:hypothetical protein